MHPRPSDPSNADTDLSDSLSGSIALVDFRAVPPSQNMLKNQFTFVATLDQKTFHTTHKVTAESADEIRTYYLKDNPETAISELEAAGAACHRILAPRYTPNTYAVYDDKLKKYVGVVSEEFPGFKSTYHDPLKEEDLNTDFIGRLSIELVDKLDLELYELEKKSDHTERKIKKINEVKKRLLQQLEKFKMADPLSEIKEEENLEKLYEENCMEEANNFKEKSLVLKDTRAFYQRIHTDHTLSKKGLENYRIKKGLATTKTASYVHMEDDLHQNNLEKTGRRIDFDMIEWPLTYNLKDSKWAYFRRPTDETFKITARDIMHFPDLEDAKPFYWPTKPFRLIYSTVDTFVSNYVPVSINAYPVIANSLYQKLEKDPVFVYHQFSTLAKYLLTNDEIYHNVTFQHMREYCSHEGKLLRPMFVTQQLVRIAAFRQMLTKIDSKDIGKDKNKDALIHQFANFFEQHSARISAELVKDLHVQNISVDEVQIEKTRAEILAQCSANLILIPKAPVEEKPAVSPVLVVAATVAPAVELKEVKPVPASPSLFDILKLEVITEIKAYKPNAVVGFFGGLSSLVGGSGGREKSPLMDAIVEFCEKLKIEPGKPDDEKVKVMILKTRLEEISKTCGTGAMFAAVTKSLSAIKKHYPEPVAKLSL